MSTAKEELVRNWSQSRYDMKYHRYFIKHFFFFGAAHKLFLVGSIQAFLWDPEILLGPRHWRRSSVGIAVVRDRPVRGGGLPASEGWDGLASRSGCKDGWTGCLLDGGQSSGIIPSPALPGSAWRTGWEVGHCP